MNNIKVIVDASKSIQAAASAAVAQLLATQAAEYKDAAALSAAQAANNAAASGAILYSTRADLFADLAHAAKVKAFVAFDTTNDYNGYYDKLGVINTGSWQKSTYIQPVVNGSVTLLSLNFLPAPGQVGKNKFNKDTVISGYYVSYTTGQKVASATWTISDFITIDPNVDCVLNYNRSDQQIAFYTAKDFASFVSGLVNNKTFTTPSTAAYIVISTRTTELAIQQLEEGTVSTTYEAWGIETVPLERGNLSLALQESTDYAELCKESKTQEAVSAVTTSEIKYTFSTNIEKFRIVSDEQHYKNQRSENIKTFSKIETSGNFFTALGLKIKAISGASFNVLKLKITYGHYVPKFVKVIVLVSGVYKTTTFKLPNDIQPDDFVSIPISETISLASGVSIIYAYLDADQNTLPLNAPTCDKTEIGDTGLAKIDGLQFVSAPAGWVDGDALSAISSTSVGSFSTDTTYLVVFELIDGGTITSNTVYSLIGAASTDNLNNPTDFVIQLPTNIYLVSGEEFSVYYGNVIKNSQAFRRGNYYIRGQKISNGVYSQKGEGYSYKWSYTPTAAETFDMEFRIIETYTGNVVASKVVTFHVADASLVANHARNVTMVTIGDSFTDDYKVSDYIYDFITSNGGVNVANMIGLNSTNRVGAKDDAWSGKTYEWFASFATGELRPDRPLSHANWDAGWGENEVNGWTTGQAYTDLTTTQKTHGKTRNEFYNPTTSTFDFEYFIDTYFSSYVPHGETGSHINIFTMLCGINDATWAVPAELQSSITAKMDNIETIIESVLAWDSNIKILLNTVTPQSADDKFLSTYGADFKHYERSKRCQEIWNQAILDTFDTSAYRALGVYVLPTAAHFDSRFALKSQTYTPCKFDLTQVETATNDIHPQTIGAKYIADPVWQYVYSLI